MSVCPHFIWRTNKKEVNFDEFSYEHYTMRVTLYSHIFHHHYLALEPFVGFRLLSQVSPSSSTLSGLLPGFYFQLV